ncbi:heavy metal-associated isoprenylated plant protein 3-like isoform X1 [Cucumis melo]|uniref:Heavy metal-associated isoprenylated plant protein 3-like isoform X1 n=1 Tax=Cucumis melo TaxID=3656 RepID=A0ABM3KQT4_CUCME|nr:heavy metal-associated isoprenylated plant protein 3-like isoform X1 [Cucumis melo]
MKKLGGFMCHSAATTAVCIPADPRSAVVSRRLARADYVNNNHANNGNRARLVSNAVKYSKLVESSPSLSVRSEGKQINLKKPAMPVMLSSPAENNNVFHVVVMRVALHCQGCASKVKRHLSKMEGVTSFSIDLEAKRVTVMGHISPLGVLQSISKVKRAELWPTQP